MSASPAPLTAAVDAAIEVGDALDDIPRELLPLVVALVEGIARLMPDPEPALAPRPARPRKSSKKVVKAHIRPPAPAPAPTKPIRPALPNPAPVQASAPKPTAPPQPPRGQVRVSAKIL